MFFFFKQKTAYEMRISDWSSDVCSSDLREAEVGYILRDGRAKILFVPTSFRGFDYVNMARALQAGLPDLATIVTVRGEAEGCLGYEELLASNAPDVASGHPDPNAVKLLLYTSGTTSHPKGVLHSHNSRSAEHPSELQSLMRISYAVLCLKQKKSTQ